MKAKIRKLEKNPRYRLLQIGNSHYLMDFGSQFWKIIFPFFFWIFPNSIYKLDDGEMVKQLKAPMKPIENEGSWLPLYAGVGVALPNVAGSLVDYFDIAVPLWLSVVLLVLALLAVAILFQTFNQRFGRKLHHNLQIESLPRYKIRLHPKSFGHVFKFIFLYMFILVLSVLSYMLYVSIQNVFVLFAASFFFFFVLVSSLYPGEEGTTTVTFKENNEKVS